MKALFVCSFLFASLAFANVSELGAVHNSGEGYSTGGTDAVVFAQSYVFADLANGIRHYSDPEGWGCDDFVLSSASVIEGVQFYIVYAGSAPSSYDFVISEDTGDSDPNTATTIWSGNAPCTLVDTGDENWGFTIWEVNCDLTGGPSLSAGPRYWLEIGFHADSITDYILVTETITGSMAWSGVSQSTYVTTGTSFGVDYDFFFNLYDTSTSLDRLTWGSIKSLY